MQYRAAIGKSSYEIPYSSDEDLPLLKELCSKVNTVVNTVIASNKNITNEQALILVLINTFYEIHTGSDSRLQNSPAGYTKEDVLKIISMMHETLHSCTTE